MTVPGHILLVDDDADLRGAVATVLHSNGYQVIEAGHGQHALEALQGAAAIRLIVLDLLMPVMDGALFLEHKARGPWSHLPVVVFSSTTPSFDLQDFGGVVSVVAKLEGIDRLLSAVRDAHDAAELPPTTSGGSYA